MKTLINKYPSIYRFALAMLLFGLALFLSGIVNKGFIKQYFPFASVIFLTAATWYLYKTDKKSLNHIGLNFKSRNLAFLPLGILIGAIAFLIAKYIRAIYSGGTFNISTDINYNNIIYGMYIILPTVAVEEFLFRGYLFKKTIEISSVIKANIIFSILFTLVHVFDDGALKQFPIFVFLAITIPVGHLLFATALLKSKTLFFPIGIHLGNNWATRHLITTTNDENSFLHITNNGTFETWPSFILFILLWNSFFLFVTFIIWKWDNIPFLNRLKKE
ncbi:MAG: CPBP family intramembrane metalloprotease [Flavobacteriaceae bacterium]